MFNKSMQVDNHGKKKLQIKVTAFCPTAIFVVPTATGKVN